MIFGEEFNLAAIVSEFVDKDVFAVGKKLFTTVFCKKLDT